MYKPQLKTSVINFTLLYNYKQNKQKYENEKLDTVYWKTQIQVVFVPVMTLSCWVSHGCAWHHSMLVTPQPRWRPIFSNVHKVGYPLCMTDNNFQSQLTQFIVNIHHSLVGNWTPRAPPGQSNETYFFRLIIMSRKQISMLTGWTNVSWGSFGGHLGFRHTRIAKVNKFHNIWTK